MADFPILDSTCTEDNCPSRIVLDDCGSIEPFVDEMDAWVDIPARVTHNADSGVVLELGPYSLTERDVERLRHALRRYDIANHGTSIRRVK